MADYNEKWQRHADKAKSSSSGKLTAGPKSPAKSPRSSLPLFPAEVMLTKAQAVPERKDLKKAEVGLGGAAGEQPSKQYLKPASWLEPGATAKASWPCMEKEREKKALPQQPVSLNAPEEVQQEPAMEEEHIYEDPDTMDYTDEQDQVKEKPVKEEEHIYEDPEEYAEEVEEEPLYQVLDPIYYMKKAQHKDDEAEEYKKAQRGKKRVKMSDLAMLPPHTLKLLRDGKHLKQKDYERALQLKQEKEK